jgi:ketosteroid isomerase-like protein
MNHVDTVQSIYQAFGQGNVPGVLAHVAPDAQWEAWADHTPQRAGHPLFAARNGPAGAGEFLQQLVTLCEIHEFQVLDVFGSGRQVGAEVLIEYTYRPTGQRMSDEELHLWTFDGAGRVARFRHYIDTAKHLRAAGLLAA